VIAGIDARKSTDQTGIADDQKSVARQVEHATAYARRKGWTVADEHVYVDDGISGAEFANRPGFLRLMNALKPRPAFHVLVMSEVSRLGREQIETAYALKQLSPTRVRCFSYLEDLARDEMPESCGSIHRVAPRSRSSAAALRFSALTARASGVWSSDVRGSTLAPASRRTVRTSTCPWIAAR
jgi:hypothetical protein